MHRENSFCIEKERIIIIIIHKIIEYFFKILLKILSKSTLKFFIDLLELHFPSTLSDSIALPMCLLKRYFYVINLS